MSKSAEIYAKRKANGLCTKCGKVPVLSGKSSCEKCALRMKDSKAAVRKQRIARGLCSKCGKVPVAPPNLDCDTCKAIQNRNNSRRRSAFHANGLCIQCGEVPPRPGKLICEDCFMRSKESKRAIRQSRKEQGLCVECGKHPAQDGHMTCSICIERKHVRHVRYRMTNGLAGAILQRDGCACRLCGAHSRRLVIHHIDGSGMEDGHLNAAANDSPENLILLCAACHNHLHYFARLMPRQELIHTLLTALASLPRPNP